MASNLDAHVSAYSRNADYSFDNELMLNWYAQRIIGQTSHRNSMLELGIGHGFTTLNFARHFRRHVVVEGSPAIISRFRSDNPDCTAELVHTYFEDFDTNERFDTIVMGFVLEHVDNPRLLLDRYRKFLAPGGRCFVAVPNGESLHRRIGQAAGLLDDMMALGQSDLAFGHHRMYSTEVLREQVRLSGWEVLNMEGLFLKPLTTVQLESLHLPPEVLQAICSVGIAYPELCNGILAEIGCDSR
jgi:SAM-dependent methyltransferase